MRRSGRTWQSGTRPGLAGGRGRPLVAWVGNGELRWWQWPKMPLRLKPESQSQLSPHVPAYLIEIRLRNPRGWILLPVFRPPQGPSWPFTDASRPRGARTSARPAPASRRPPHPALRTPRAPRMASRQPLQTHRPCSPAPVGPTPVRAPTIRPRACTLLTVPLSLGRGGLETVPFPGSTWRESCAVDSASSSMPDSLTTAQDGPQPASGWHSRRPVLGQAVLPTLLASDHLHHPG